MRGGSRLRAAWGAVLLAGVTACVGAPPSAVTPGPASRSTAQAVASAVERPLVHLAVLGDVGTGDRHERATAAAAAGRRGSGWDGLLLLGDNVYDDGDPERARQTVLGPLAPVLEGGVPLTAVLGNHDVGVDAGATQLQALGQPGPWFARRVGDVLLVALDSNRPDDARQLAWLEEELSRPRPAWTVVLMHHPMWSVGHYGSDLRVRAAFAPVLERHHVDLVLAGHEHDYQRTAVLSGTTYVVAGSAAKLRPAGQGWPAVVTRSRRGFVELSAYDDRLVLQAVDTGGVTFDGVVIPASPPTAASQVGHSTGTTSGGSLGPETKGPA